MAGGRIHVLALSTWLLEATSAARAPALGSPFSKSAVLGQVLRSSSLAFSVTSSFTLMDLCDDSGALLDFHVCYKPRHKRGTREHLTGNRAARHVGVNLGLRVLFLLLWAGMGQSLIPFCSIHRHLYYPCTLLGPRNTMGPQILAIKSSSKHTCLKPWVVFYKTATIIVFISKVQSSKL